jgi:ribose/xylose/arabinose/galactoside ABC-type transport system permease subunit
LALVLEVVSLLALARLAAWRVARWELGEGACVVVFNVVVGLGICCGCFPGFLRARGVL